MKIMFFSFEVYPLAKVGGLADVVGSLPKFLKREGHEVSIIMPMHKVVEKNIEKYNLKVEKIYVLEKMGDRMVCGEIKVEDEVIECK